MSNKENYKKAFSVLQSSKDFCLEEKKMAMLKKKTVTRNIVAAAAALVLVFGFSGTAYAMNACGIQRTIQLWIHGDQTEVTVDYDGEGGYTMHYVDENGEVREQGGGGIAIDYFGNERPLTPDELQQEMFNNVEVIFGDDGSAILYYQDQVVDITDKFEDGYCHVLVKGADGDLYVTVEYQGGWAASSNKYPDL